MRYYSHRNYFYRLTIIIGLAVVVGIFLLWFRSVSKEPAQTVKSGFENPGRNLPPTVTAIETPALTATTILTSTEMPLVPVKEVVTPTITTPIYILGKKIKTNIINVWQLLPDNSHWSKLYTITYPLDKSNEVTVPPQEIERMKKYLATAQPPLVEYPPGPVFERSPLSLALSPTVKQLAFVEWYSVYVSVSEEGLFGVAYTGNFMPESNQSQIFFQSPLHVFVDRLDYLATLGMPLWSPNAQYYSVQQNLIHQNSTPLIINVNTGEVQRLEGAADLFGPLAWSPDSTTVFLYLYRSGFDSSGGLIRLCQIEPLNCRDIELDGVWIDAWMADWSPQRNQVVFAGANEDFNSSFSPPPFSLYVFDPKTDTVRELIGNFNRSLAKPHWSPDGRLIAAEYNDENVDADPNSIVIVDPEAKQVITKIPFGGCTWPWDTWQWDQNSQSIVQLTCGIPRKLMVSNVFDKSNRQIELPSELSDDAWLGFNTIAVFQ